jgi:hypothetical protein
MGAACASGCPVTLPEVNNLALWLVGDDYYDAVNQNCPQTGICIWKNRAPTPAYGQTTQFPYPDYLTVGGGTVDFAWWDPSNVPLGWPFPAWFDVVDKSPGTNLFASNVWTIYLVALPQTGAAGYAALLDLFDGSGQHVKIQRDGTNNNLVFQVLPGNGGTNYIVSGPGNGAASGWSGNWERIYAYVDQSGTALLQYSSTATGSNSVVSGNVGAATLTEYGASVVGAEAQDTSVAMQGGIAEIIVFKTALLSGSSQSAIQTYLKNRYGF